MPFRRLAHITGIALFSLLCISAAYNFSRGTILDARRILLLASGASKAGVVRRVLRGPVSESLPATALQLHADVTVIIDRPAAP